MNNHRFPPKIAYIELDTHPEIAYKFIKLMEGNPSLEVDYYFSEKILKLLPDLPNVNIFRTSAQMILAQLSRHNYTGVIIGTAHRYFNLFNKITARYRTGIIVHNLNFAKASSPKILYSMWDRDIKYRLKLLFKEGLLSKNLVYHNANRLWVLDENMSNKYYQELPIFFNEYLENDINNNKKSIVIPGAVSQGRRDYKSVIQQLKNITSELRVVFLGKAQGEELAWIKELKKERKTNLEIIFFENKVPQATFENYMVQADIIWSPLQKHIKFLGITETYGESKMSGNIADAITYNKPIVFSKNIWEILDYLYNYNNYPFKYNKDKHSVKQKLENQLLDFLD